MNIIALWRTIFVCSKRSKVFGALIIWDVVFTNLGYPTPVERELPTIALMQIVQTTPVPLAYAENVIGVEGANVECICRHSGATLSFRLSEGVADRWDDPWHKRHLFTGSRSSSTYSGNHLSSFHQIPCFLYHHQNRILVLCRHSAASHFREAMAIWARV